MSDEQRFEPAADVELGHAQQEYEDASRRSGEAQEALGQAEDELSAAEAGRDAAEREPGGEAGAEDRLEAAEHAWDDRVEDAEQASRRVRGAERSLDSARSARDSESRNGPSDGDEHRASPDER